MDSDAAKELVDVLMGMAHREERDKDLLEDTTGNKKPEVPENITAFVLSSCVVQLEIQDIRPLARSSVVDCT